MALSDVKCKNLRPREKAFKKADGEGLFLLVQPTGGKLWWLALNSPVVSRHPAVLRICCF